MGCSNSLVDSFQKGPGVRSQGGVNFCNSSILGVTPGLKYPHSISGSIFDREVEEKSPNALRLDSIFFNARNREHLSLKTKQALKMGSRMPIFRSNGSHFSVFSVLFSRSRVRNGFSELV